MMCASLPEQIRLIRLTAFTRPFMKLATRHMSKTFKRILFLVPWVEVYHLEFMKAKVGSMKTSLDEVALLQAGYITV